MVYDSKDSKCKVPEENFVKEMFYYVGGIAFGFVISTAIVQGIRQYISNNDIPQQKTEIITNNLETKLNDEIILDKSLMKYTSNVFYSKKK
jgi:hypothetical protein